MGLHYAKWRKLISRRDQRKQLWIGMAELGLIWRKPRAVNDSFGARSFQGYGMPPHLSPRIPCTGKPAATSRTKNPRSRKGPLGATIRRPRDFLVISLCHNVFLTLRLQPIVVKSQSFRKLLEFWTFVAENDDKSKKIVYDSGLRPAARQSGGPSLGRSPTRKSSVTPSIKTKSEFLGKQGRHNF